VKTWFQIPSTTNEKKGYSVISLILSQNCEVALIYKKNDEKCQQNNQAKPGDKISNTVTVRSPERQK
jgi:hypothetical protein